eukprot:6758048-Alexandrium_andersonii.AAC.1
MLEVSPDLVRRQVARAWAVPVVDDVNIVGDPAHLPQACGQAVRPAAGPGQEVEAARKAGSAGG